jgi:hypothetical protein
MWHDNPFDSWDEQRAEFVPRWICFGKGGGSAPPQTNTVNQGGLPDYAEPFYTRLMQRAETESNQEYTPYDQQRLADFSNDTQNSFSAIRDISAGGTPGQIRQAGDLYSEVGGYQTGGPFNTNRAPDFMSDYINPYVTNVLDRNRTRAQQGFNEAQTARDADFARRGSFSSSRRDVASEMARSDLNEQLLDIEAKGMADAWAQGAELFTSDENRALNAQVESERAAQAAESLRTGAAQGLAGLGQLDQTLALQRADSLGLTGAMQEERDQASLDLAYADEVNQRDYDRQNINWMSGIMHGVPIAAQSETTRYEAPPSALSQMLGLGLGAYGLYNNAKSGGGR